MGARTSFGKEPPIAGNSPDSRVHRILVAAHVLSESLNSACEQAGVSLPLARAFQILATSKKPVTPTELSRGLGRSPAATSELIKRLVNAGHITADVDAADRRSFRLALTAAGRRKWEQVRSSLEQAEAMVEKACGKQKMSQLAGAIDEMAARLKAS